jgi:hypothetical protein
MTERIRDLLLSGNDSVADSAYRIANSLEELTNNKRSKRSKLVDTPREFTPGIYILERIPSIDYVTLFEITRAHQTIIVKLNGVEISESTNVILTRLVREGGKILSQSSSAYGKGTWLVWTVSIE